MSRSTREVVARETPHPRETRAPVSCSLSLCLELGRMPCALFFSSFSCLSRG